MPHLPDALVAGILAGYGIAIPVGPIAVLIFDTGLRRGLRTAVAAGAGAASADGFYATLAGLVGGALAALIQPVILPARILGAALLVLIAFRGLAGAVAAARDGRPGEGGGSTAAGNAAGTAGESAARPPGAAAGTRSAARTYLLFLGLTIVNPMTLLYFAALMLGLPVATGGEGRLLFVVGAFGASLSWQWLLAAAGALLHGRLPERVQAFTGAVGSVIVLGFAARLLLAT